MTVRALLAGAARWIGERLAGGARPGQAAGSPWKPPAGWPAWQPLTAPGGAFEAPASLREVLAIATDLTVSVFAGRRRSPDVVSFLETLQDRHRVAFPVIREVDDLQAIASLYDPAQAPGMRRSDALQNPALARFFDLARKLEQAGATDMHIDIVDGQAVIWARVKKRFRRELTLPFAEGMQLVNAIYRLGTSQTHNDFDPRKRQSCLIADKNLPARWATVRYSGAPLRDDGHTVALRFPNLAEETHKQPLHERGYAARHIEDFDAMVRRPYGGNLIAGPMGSGKTTLLAGLISEDQIRLEKLDQLVRTVTAEDPPELPIYLAAQIPAPKGEYEATVEHLMRMDANRLIISEIRGRATAMHFVEACSTNHQCWSTTHATSGPGIILRLMILGVEPWLLSTTEIISGLVAQRLVNTLCPACAQPIMQEGRYLKDAGLSPVLRDWLQGHFRDDRKLDRVHVRRPRQTDCDQCGGSGYGPPTPICETLVPDDDILDLLTRKRFVEAHRHWRVRLDGYSMADHAADKVAAGLIDPRDLEWMLRDHLRTLMLLKQDDAGRPVTVQLPPAPTLAAAAVVPPPAPPAAVTAAGGAAVRPAKAKSARERNNRPVQAAKKA